VGGPDRSDVVFWLFHEVNNFNRLDRFLSTIFISNDHGLIRENKARHGFFTMWTPLGFASWIPQSGIRVGWEAVWVGRGDFAEGSEVCDGGWPSNGYPVLASSILGRLCASTPNTQGKSPVRESCTPGSVRGVSGNGHPCRDYSNARFCDC
jgi:hypothetical protein